MDKKDIIKVYIALGSNIGDRLANLETAISLLPPSVNMLAQSSVYRTAPWGFEEQPEFLNQVILGATSLPPLDLLTSLKEIEAKVGRTPTFRYGPREVDLDILTFGNLVFNHPQLQIPHPRMHERAFVLIPLKDLNPDFSHPQTGASIPEMLAPLEQSSITVFAD